MQTIPILMYHNIDQPPAGARLRNLYVSPFFFAWQMALLRLLGIQGLSMSAAMPYLRGEKKGRIVVLTFDDGYVDTLKNALPVLLKYGFTATCYFVSQRLGQFNDWDASTLNVRKPLMSGEQLCAWQAAGMEVGAHSRTHPRLTTCSDAQLVEELVDCKVELEMLLGSEVSQFCYPYGDVDARVSAATQQAGFVAATTTRRGRAQVGDNHMILKRILVTGRTLPHLFLLKLFSRYEDQRG